MGDIEGLRAELEEVPGESVPARQGTSGGTIELDAAEEPAATGRSWSRRPSRRAGGDAEPLGDEVIPEPRGGEPLPEPPTEGGETDDEHASEAAEVADEPSESRSGGGQPGGDPDTEGARLIALNMALSGSSRNETAEYLRDTFGIEDGALLDDVYERVQAS